MSIILAAFLVGPILLIVVPIIYVFLNRRRLSKLNKKLGAKMGEDAAKLDLKSWQSHRRLYDENFPKQHPAFKAFLDKTEKYIIEERADEIKKTPV